MICLPEPRVVLHRNIGLCQRFRAAYTQFSAKYSVFDADPTSNFQSAFRMDIICVSFLQCLAMILIVQYVHIPSTPLPDAAVCKKATEAADSGATSLCLQQYLT